jgi:hypothetical protein
VRYYLPISLIVMMSCYLLGTVDEWKSGEWQIPPDPVPLVSVDAAWPTTQPSADRDEIAAIRPASVRYDGRPSKEGDACVHVVGGPLR